MVWLRKQEIYLQWCTLKNYGENGYSEIQKNGTHSPLINFRNFLCPGHFKYTSPYFLIFCFFDFFSF